MILVKPSFHIEGYVIPQYGDYPDEMIEGFNLVELKSQLKRYVGRIGTGVRGDIEALRDCYKIAHYACFVWKYLERRGSGGDKV